MLVCNKNIFRSSLEVFRHLWQSSENLGKLLETFIQPSDNIHRILKIFRNLWNSVSHFIRFYSLTMQSKTRIAVCPCVLVRDKTFHSLPFYAEWNFHLSSCTATMFIILFNFTIPSSTLPSVLLLSQWISSADSL